MSAFLMSMLMVTLWAGDLKPALKPELKKEKYELQFSISRKHGCLRSFSSHSRFGSLVLNVNTAGASSMLLQYEGHKTFGPNLGGYKSGDKSFDHSSYVVCLSWSGKATSQDDGVVSVKLKGVKRSVGINEQLPTPSSKIAAPKSCLPGPSLTLKCSPALVNAAEADVDKLYSLSDDDTAKTKHRIVKLLKCVAPALPEELDFLGSKGAIYLGPAKPAWYYRIKDTRPGWSWNSKERFGY